MKHTFTLAIFWMFMLAIVPKAFSQDPNFYIFLCFGQSNMEGQGPIEAQDQTVNSRFQVMQAVACNGQPANTWRTATPPIARCNTKLGPSDYFGREMIANLPANVKIGIVHVSIAGSKIEIFDKANYQTYLNGLAAGDQYIKNIANEYGGNPYAKLVALAKLAQQDGVIKGILMHQGESNTGDNAWPTKVKGVYTNLLTDLGLSASNVPLLAGQVVDAAQGGLCASMNNIINTLPNTIPTSYVISSSGCTDQSDNLHFTSAGYRILGARYAQKMLTLLPAATGSAPVVSLTAPTTTSYTSPANITITATATDADGTISNVKFYNGTNLLGTISTSPYTYTWTNIAVGTYSITAVATDNSGTSTTSTAKSITVTLATGTAPVVSLTAPTATSFTAPASITITASATDADGTISNVKFYNGTNLLSTVTTSPYTYTWTGVAAGTYSITAVATDNSGSTTTSTAKSVTVTGGTTTSTVLGKCKGKYFGNIIANNVPANYTTYWNQVTSENASKWGSVETSQGNYNFSGSDVAYNWAKNNGGLFKYHNFVWGQQTPGYVSNTSTSVATIRTGVENYIKACSTHYAPMGGLKMIDVLNEPVNTAMPANLKAALTAGYQADPANAADKNNPYGWVIWPFQLARKYFPDAVLLINEYNVEMNWGNCRQPYIDMVNAVKNAPNLTDGRKNLIDGVGLQCHGIDNLTAANFKACIDEIWNKTGVAIHITEFDQEANPNEAKQTAVYTALIPVAWEHPHVAGITLWGYIQGTTWRNGNGTSGASGTDSGIMYANGNPRPAMTWLQGYMSGRPSLACCPAPAPFGDCVNACTTPAPTVPAAIVNYDLNAVATQLTATGTALKWYTVETGGTALTAAPTPSTTVAGKIIYYVGQTLNGCEGPRTSVTVNVANNYKIFKVGAPITIDGTIDAVWNNASVLPAAAAKLLSGTVTNSTDLSGNFKALWDDTYLYVLADVTDDVLKNESANVYDDDAVEVYIDINNDKATAYGTNDVQYSFGWNDGTTVGVLPTGRSVTGITYSAVARTGGYIVEARIPWTTLQGVPAVGQLVGVDFMINDDDDNGTRDGKLSWNAATDNAWQDPSLFGTAILQGVLPCTTPAAPTVTATVAYCQNATATQLTATGTGLKWYADNTTTTALANAPTPSTSAAGTTNYFVSQATNGCESARAQIAVTVNALPTATITAVGATTFCTGGSVALTASAGSSYVWKNGSTQVGTSATYTAIAAGSYTVEVTNANNCKATSAATTVTVNAAPNAPTVTPTVTYCQNAAATQLTATGTALKWYADNITTTALANAPTPSTTAAGTTSYFVSQTTSGCESSRAQIAVTVNALPTAVITANGSTTFCTGGSVTLTSSAGSSYIWKNGTTQVGTAATYSATAAGSYTVEVTNATNCKATSAATVVTINTAGAAPTVTPTAVYCQNVTATQLTATGTGLKWYADNTTTVALANAPTPSTTSAGVTSYFVSQTTSGCESPRAQIAVTVNALPIATITAGSATTFCTGGSVTLTSSAGSSYIWKNGTAQVGISATYAATAAGSYTVEVTNANNCKATSAATVVTIATPPAAPTVTSTAAYCQNAAATQLTATGTGLKWYADNTTTVALTNAPTPSTTATGTISYFVSQTTSGCESSRAQIDVTINALPTAVITPLGSTVIPAGSSVTLNANTGTGLLYKWFKGSIQVGTASSYVANAAGSYVVEVTNDLGCKATSLAVDVTNASNQPSQITITSPTSNAATTGTITITANVSDPDGNITLVEYLDGNTVIGTSTSQPYSFDWTNPGNGTHTITVRVTDSNGGITTSAPVTITSSTISTGVTYSANISATVYPNPSNGDVFVETDMDLSNANFRIVNVLGEEAVLSASIHANGARLDVSSLTEGAYILIITEGTSVLRKKITVIR